MDSSLKKDQKRKGTDDEYVKRKQIRTIKESETNQTKQAREEELRRLNTNIDEIFLSSDDEEDTHQQTSSKRDSFINHTDDNLNVPDENGKIRVNVNHDDQPPIYVAEHLAKILKPHQIGGIRFMYDNLIENYQTFDATKGLGCILAHSMGLGKTLQVICLIDIYFKYTNSKKVMIIVPVSVLNNWYKEFEMWLPKNANYYKRKFGISIANHGKSNDEKKAIICNWNTKGGVLLIGFECYCKMANETSLTKMLQNSGPDFVICDEGHRIKNNESKTSKQLKRIRTQRRLILTGTPLQNNLVEYWCMVDFVRPHFLGSKEEFINKFERPITNGQCKNSTEHDIYLMKQQTHVLNKLIRGFIQRRNNDLLNKDLPVKYEYVIPIKSTNIQMQLMKTFLKTMLTGKHQYNPVTLASMLLKIWNHPDIFYDCFTSQKLEPEIEANTNSAELSIIKKSLISTQDILANYDPGIPANGNKILLLLTIINMTAKLNEKILVFSQSLTTLTLIEKFLSKETFINGNKKKKHWIKNQNYLRLDGTLLNNKKVAVIDKFNQSSEIVLLLISTKAGCLGINLTSANRLILYDTSWNPTNDSQATCRIYRYGQKKVCYIYRFVAYDSMEKRLFDQGLKKEAIASRVIDEKNPQWKMGSRDIHLLINTLNTDYTITVSEEKAESYQDDILKLICRELNDTLVSEPYNYGEQFLDDKETNLTSSQKLQAEEKFKRLNKRLAFPELNMEKMTLLKRKQDFFIWSRTKIIHYYKNCSLKTLSEYLNSNGYETRLVRSPFDLSIKLCSNYSLNIQRNENILLIRAEHTYTHYIQTTNYLLSVHLCANQIKFLPFLESKYFILKRKYDNDR